MFQKYHNISFSVIFRLRFDRIRNAFGRRFVYRILA